MGWVCIPRCFLIGLWSSTISLRKSYPGEKNLVCLASCKHVPRLHTTVTTVMTLTDHFDWLASVCMYRGRGIPRQRRLQQTFWRAILKSGIPFLLLPETQNLA
ncbi:hypothetical protein DPMN_054710 [Dreissena polymorpha]|uniref:Secreted protein n=1 Tax=Dreissena polymorpha TaxID=45954 RepID=A0A9D4CNL7_DREPO|nr:hypothetical protein DPMN_054710 [Dreissena polymorpha]